MVPQLVKPTFKLYDANGALDKRWFVYWYDGSARRKKYGSINTGQTVHDRHVAAKKLIEKLKRESIRVTSKTENALYEVIERLSVGWDKKTKQDYKSKYVALLTWLGGNEITKPLMEDFFIHLRRKLHPTTVNKYRMVLLMLFTHLGCEHLFEDIPRLKAYRTPKRYFQSYQARLIGLKIQESNPSLWLFIQFMYYVALRPKEIRMLKLTDIEFDDWRIRIPGTISKNNKTQYVNIPEAFASAIEGLFERSPDDYIFRGRGGGMIGENTMYERHKAILKSMNYGSEYSLYSWRHTAAVALVKAGATMKEIQIHFRHHSIAQTDEYLRQLGFQDVKTLGKIYPDIMGIKKRH